MLEMLETIARDRRCPSSALRIAVALARHAGEEGPGLVDLCAVTGMSEGTVLRAVRIMRDRGQVVTTPATVSLSAMRGTPRRSWTPNLRRTVCKCGSSESVLMTHKSPA
jgi:hypothetical protein